jgi:hypothetical protein
MIEAQCFLWTVLFLASVIVTYFYFRAENSYVFITSILFGMLLGIGTSWFWILITDGLGAFDWKLFVLPVIFGIIFEVLYLAYYMGYHSRKVFPKRRQLPISTVQRTGMYIAILGVFLSIFSIALTQMPSADTELSIATLGSAGNTIVQSADIESTPVITADSSNILIQTSVVNPTQLRGNPRVGEEMNFRVDFNPSFPYTVPTLSIFVKDQYGNLIQKSELLTYSIDENSIQGTIFCNDEGRYDLVVMVYDGDVCIESKTMSYMVYGVFSDVPYEDIAMILALGMSACIFLLFLAYALYKWKISPY